MTKVFEDEMVAKAFRDASEALRRGDPDTLAGRFSPKPSTAETPPTNNKQPARQSAGA